MQDIRDLDKQVELQALIMNYFIPQEFQDLIEQHVQWDEEEQEWHLVRYRAKVPWYQAKFRQK